MADLSYTDVLHVDLGKLNAAVADWRSTVSDLKTLADQAENGLRAKSENANWAGLNADVTRGFIRKTAKEFSDAHAEAKSVYAVIDDAHTELLGIQKKMRTAIEVDAVNLGIRIEDIGGGRVRWYFPHQRGDSDEHTQKQTDSAQALADHVTSLVANASEIDASVARALNKVHSDDANNFGHDNYESLDEAETQRALELAAKGTKMTDKELAEFNSIVKYNADDPDFTTAFYTGLDQEGTLEFYGSMALDGTDGTDKTRLALTQSLQRNLGMALATATNHENEPHLSKAWSITFRRLGTQRFALDGQEKNEPYGYQILGGLLRYGNYDPSFINPIAEHIIQLHHDDPDRFQINRLHGSGETDYGFNPSGKVGSGYDPLTSVLEALGHSPKAAEQLFSDSYTPTVYNEDGTVKDHPKPLGYDYFDELTKKDFDWPPDGWDNPVDKATNTAVARAEGETALGHAFEAATSGVAYDSDAKTPPHSENSAALVHKLVDYYGSNTELLDGSPLRTSLGHVTAEYMRDVQGSFMGDPDTVATHGASANLGTFDSQTNPDGLEAKTLKNFLGAVGKDPDAYGSILNAQQAVTTDLVNGGVKDASGYAQASGNADNMVRPGAEIAGIMAESRAQAEYDDKIATDADFNESLGTGSKWAGRVIGLGVGAIPVGGEVVGWITEDVQEAVVNHYTHDSSGAAGDDMDAFIENQRFQSKHAAYDAAYTAAIQAGYPADQANTLAEHAKDQALSGYTDGRQRAEN
ncbi:hypothetical protein ACGFY7_25975 [Streptomyces prunicolor]|uniref:hypothetical protein n=1 Tax=Streptomyces prunicolor TaxID=67348 RepID=UPI00371A7A62